MARKKQEIALQLEVETQEEWEELLTKEGLIVIDVYQEWAGPCKAMQTNLRRLRNELGDELLRFAMLRVTAVEVYQEWAGKSEAMLTVFKECLVRLNHDKTLKLAAAKCDTIDSLERYRGKCEPCFLFYAGGVLVAVVRGANAPSLSKTVIAELAKEHKVLDGAAERVEIRDPAFSHLDAQEKSSLDEEENEKDEEDMVPKEVTVALLKPDVVKEGKTEEVLEKMKEAGIEILKHEERQLTEDEAKDFYSHLSEESFFEELIQFMCSGPSHVLVLSKPAAGKGILEEWRELIGPTSVEEAKESAPNSLRALYGTRQMFNALHGSDSQTAAARELAFFFPDYQIPMVSKSGSAKQARQKGVQRTVALIRPDALLENKDAILQKIREAGFTIALEKEILLTKEQVEEFYKEHTEQPYFEELVARMTSGPVLALGLAREDAINEWRNLLGPTTVSEAKETAPNSLRAQFSIDGSEINMLHGSDTPSSAQQELEFFFPVQQTVAVIKPDAYDNKDAIMDKIKQAGFHIAARKETTLTKEVAEMLYQSNSDKEYFNDLVDHMVSGPTLFMVLSKEDAVENWRGVIGPTDPTAAKEMAPDSIRAQFGQDIKANAVHGVSTTENASKVIQEVFGDLQFSKRGDVNKGSSTLKEGVEISTGREAVSADDDQTAESGEQVEGQQEAAQDKPAEQQEAAEDKPAEQQEAAEDKPAEQQEAAEDKPAEQQEAAEDKPAEQQEAAEDKPAEQQEAAEDKPAEQQEATKDKPAEQQEAAEDKPAEQQEAAEDKPAEQQEAAEDKPAEQQEAAEDKPAEQQEATGEENKGEEGESKQEEAQQEEVKAEDNSDKPEDKPAEGTEDAQADKDAEQTIAEGGEQAPSGDNEQKPNEPSE